MKLSQSLPVLLILSAVVSSSNLLSAQTASPAPVQASAPAPTFYAELTQPASSSSSTDAFLSNAPAQTSAPAAPAATSGGSSGGPFSGLGVGVKAGVAGIGFDVATPLVPTRLNLRGGATFFSYSLNQTTSDNLNVNGTLKLQNSGIMLDWFPWHGSFRLSGGATVYNNKGVTATLNEASGSSFTLGNDKYYASGPVVGTGVFKLGGNAGGRMSFGGEFVPKPGHHFSFDTEFGIEFVSKPTVALGFTGNVCPSSQGANCESPYNAATNTTFLSDVSSEQSKLQSDVNFLSFYPSSRSASATRFTNASTCCQAGRRPHILILVRLNERPRSLELRALSFFCARQRASRNREWVLLNSHDSHHRSRSLMLKLQAACSGNTDNHSRFAIAHRVRFPRDSDSIVVARPCFYGRGGSALAHSAAMRCISGKNLPHERRKHEPSFPVDLCRSRLCPRALTVGGIRPIKHPVHDFCPGAPRSARSFGHVL